jgi:hypothetical protein
MQASLLNKIQGHADYKPNSWTTNIDELKGRIKLSTFTNLSDQIEGDGSFRDTIPNIYDKLYLL